MRPLAPGDELRVDPAPGELWAYLAVRGGVDAEPMLGSRSWDSLARIGPPPPAVGTVLAAGADPGTPIDAVLAPPRAERAERLGLLAGPRRDWFGDDAWSTLVTASWQVTDDRSRVGVRLQRSAARARRRPAGAASSPREGLVRGADAGAAGRAARGDARRPPDHRRLPRDRRRRRRVAVDELARLGPGSTVPVREPRRSAPVPRDALARDSVPNVERRDLRTRERVRGHVHAPRPASPQPRRGGPLPVPPGRLVGPQLQRVPPERRPAVSRRRVAPRVRHARVRLAVRPGRPRQGRRADPRGAGAVGRGASRRGGHPRHGLPVQEQHRLGRQQLRVPRELPHPALRRHGPLRRGAHPVLREPPDLHRRRQGAAHRPRRVVLDRPARRAHLGGRVARPPPAAARSSTPATSRTPTPSATGASTSSSATRT